MCCTQQRLSGAAFQLLLHGLLLLSQASSNVQLWNGKVQWLHVHGWKGLNCLCLGHDDSFFCLLGADSLQTVTFSFQPLIPGHFMLVSQVFHMWPWALQWCQAKSCLTLACIRFCLYCTYGLTFRWPSNSWLVHSPHHRVLHLTCSSCSALPQALLYNMWL